VLLVGGKLVALVDDDVAGSARAAAALEARRRATAAKGLLLLSSALDTAFGGTLPPPLPDGGDNIADIVAAIAADKRGVIDERRIAAHAATRDRVRAASAAATAVAQAAAMPGELEDLGGAPSEPVHAPDPAELNRLRTEVQRRVVEMTRSVAAARDTAAKLGEDATAARGRGADDEASQLERRADVERARMHALLAELATLDAELKELERASRVAAEAARNIPPEATRPPRPPPTSPLDDQLDALKQRATASPGEPRPSSRASAKKPAATNLDDELAALKQKMASAPPKKKP
jgi:hypothetical protein